MPSFGADRILSAQNQTLPHYFVKIFFLNSCYIWDLTFNAVRHDSFFFLKYDLNIIGIHRHIFSRSDTVLTKILWT